MARQIGSIADVAILATSVVIAVAGMVALVIRF
jgi:hypothetical protein